MRGGTALEFDRGLFGSMSRPISYLLFWREPYSDRAAAEWDFCAITSRVSAGSA